MKTSNTIPLLAILLMGLLAPSCARLDPSGPYNGDSTLYQADGAIVASYEVLHSFVAWEAKRRDALTDHPEITAYADKVRAHSQEWIASAIALRDAYKANPADPAPLNRALSVLREAVAQASAYLLAAAGTTPATIEPKGQ